MTVTSAGKHKATRMASKFAPKDPKAIERGKKSGVERKSKEPAESTDSIAVNKLDSSDKDEIILKDHNTQETLVYRRNLEGDDVERNQICAVNDFFGWKSEARKALRESVFNSDFTADELRGLDLKANAVLFPELVNRDTDLRERPLRSFIKDEHGGRFTSTKRQKNNSGKANAANQGSEPDETQSAKRQKTNSGKANAIQQDSELDKTQSEKEILASLKAKAKWFQDIKDAAKKQHGVYSAAAQEVNARIKAKEQSHNSDLQFEPFNIPRSGLEDALNEDMRKATMLSKEEWRTRERSLCSHVKALAENYRQELSFLSIVATRAVKQLEYFNRNSAVLLYNLEKHDISSGTAQKWFLEKTNPDTHVCGCRLCKGEPNQETPQLVGSYEELADNLWNEYFACRKVIQDGKEAQARMGESIWETGTAHTEMGSELRETGQPLQLPESGASLRQKAWEEKWKKWDEERLKEIDRKAEATKAEKARIEWTMEEIEGFSAQSCTRRFEEATKLPSNLENGQD